ncbi:hypothetical protein [Paracoccus sp. NBH48]|uniref:hypothetical protein n=1 Tax=Paracoccus sp. NBH48 TaxID=2596918 RepID=UPI001891E903|nr:hypothetical protein [Paracoccus sp. NBH48]
MGGIGTGSEPAICAPVGAWTGRAMGIVAAGVVPVTSAASRAVRYWPYRSASN